MEQEGSEKWWADRMDSKDDLDEIITHHMAKAYELEEDEAELEELFTRKHGGSRPRRSPNVNRDHAEGHRQIWDDYFSDNPTYPTHIFRRRFRITKPLFMKIHDRLLEEVPYFVQKSDALGHVGLSSIQKMTAAMRMFTMGVVGDAMDEYVRIGESTALESFERFASGIVTVFGPEYLRYPTEDDIRKQMEINRTRGFVGMFGSMDCTHWVWKNCLVGLQGQYRDKDGHNSTVLEAISTSNLWILHAFIGIPGSNNDINVVDRSPLLVNILSGDAPWVGYSVNGHDYNMFYLLVDGIYPDYSIFQKTIPEPMGQKRKWFAKRQEACRKDVERCFGVLQARFAVVQNPGRSWDLPRMVLIWKAAVVMHNMIVEDEEGHPEFDQVYLFENPGAQVPQAPRPPLTFNQLTHAMGRIRDPTIANQLQDDLVEHLWQVRGDEDD